ncbi:MAG: PIN domain-containing protein [Candidatus Methylacidiphilales bacterium]|nr:PIN domain-containing protein [Candidatus Methylacidiphilales bacterium]
MIYCDSSFLVSLYLPNDAFYAQAGQEVKKFKHSVPYTLLNELEIVTTLQRALAQHRLSKPLFDTILRQIAMDEANAFLKSASVDHNDVHRHAIKLSKQYTSQFLCRTLDILHVASAIAVNASSFASFDNRQRSLAAAAGLTLVPA